jgi:hypothetical protein
MIRKCFLTVSILLPLVAVSGAADAGGMNKRAPASQIAPLINSFNGYGYASEGSRSCTYRGGVKSTLWTCQ